jgi:hypothetical protein
VAVRAEMRQPADQVHKSEVDKKPPKSILFRSGRKQLQMGRKIAKRHCSGAPMFHTIMHSCQRSPFAEWRSGETHF